MPLKVEAPEEPTMNMTPMIDIVLLLVIFFMVGTQFTEEESQFDIELPTVAKAEPLTGGPDAITVSVHRDGSFTLGNRTVSTSELERELRAAQARYARQAVIVRGDGPGPYQHVMTVLDICRRSKIVNIQLANRPDDEGA
ncbi:MAG: biopolymer transporter ExbD [Planctomycetaceae bacterium]|nr:biopolymer transporter ExbD [Planctomycetaceae bacterium]